MPAVGDYLKAGQDRLWAIFEADATWTNLVRAGNRIKRTGANPYPQKTNKAPGDCGEVEISVARGNLAGYTGLTTVTFDVSRGSAPAAAFNVDNSVIYQMITTWMDLRSNNATSLLARTEYLLLNSGAKLALSGATLTGVKSWGPISFTHVEGSSPETGGTLRLQQRIFIPVNYKLTKAQILG